MITSLRKRTRPDNLVNQVRAGGKSLARRIYLLTIGAVVALLSLEFLGPVIFLDADGLASKERLVVATDYSARIDQILIKPGDMVREGQPIASLSSTDVVNQLAELGSKRTSLAARAAQIESRLGSLGTLTPLAIERTQRAKAAMVQLNDLVKRQLTTSARVAEGVREFYEAEREEAQVNAENRTLAGERGQVEASLKELDKLIGSLKASYNDGILLAQIDGRVGSRVPSRGQVLKRGDAIVDLFHGETHVIAYVPNNRLYSVEPGEVVVVTDGITRRHGRVQRVETVTDSLPAEFQSQFRTIERQQVMRIAFEGEPPFPILAKVKVMSRMSPYALAAMARTAISVAGGPMEAARMVVSELMGQEAWKERGPWAPHDPMTVGTIRKPGAGPVYEADEDQPFPEPSAPLTSPAQAPKMLRVIDLDVAGSSARLPGGHFSPWP
jgi:multidrug resistance efflux pump